MKYTLLDIQAAHERAVRKVAIARHVTHICKGLKVNGRANYDDGVIVRTSIRMFTVIDNQGNAHSFAGKTLAGARDSLIAYLQGARNVEMAA